MFRLYVQYIVRIFKLTLVVFNLLKDFLQRKISQVRKYDVIAERTVLTF